MYHKEWIEMHAKQSNNSIHQLPESLWHPIKQKINQQVVMNALQ
jgi:hypothetical protein